MGTTSGTFSGYWNNDRSWWQQNFEQEASP